MTATLPRQSRSFAEHARPERPDRCDLTGLATDLHDGLAQELFAARMLVDDALAVGDLPQEAKAKLEQLSLRLTGSSHTLRTTLLRWRRSGSEPTSRPVLDRVRDCVRQFERTYGVPITVDVSGHGPEPGHDGAELVVRTVREGLANIAKHARASRAAVALVRSQRCWSVTVEDDGIGDAAFAGDHTDAAAGPSFGLSSLADQAARAAGNLAVRRSARLGGLLLTTSVPAGKGAA